MASPHPRNFRGKVGKTRDPPISSLFLRPLEMYFDGRRPHQRERGRRKAKVFPCAFQGKRRVGDFRGPTKGATREVGMIARKASPPFIPRPGLTKNKPPTLFLSFTHTHTHTPFSLSICRPKKNPRGECVFFVWPRSASLEGVLTSLIDVVMLDGIRAFFHFLSLSVSFYFFRLLC